VQQVLEVVVLPEQLVCKAQLAQLAVVQQEQPVQLVHLVPKELQAKSAVREIKVPLER
jgi:hypothetical protein